MKRYLYSSVALVSVVIFDAQVLAQNFDFVADYVRYEDPRQWVVIDGNVDISTEYGYFYPTTVEYDITNELLYIEGQLNGVLPTGQRFITQYAELDFQTQNAIAMQVRSIFAGDIQAAASFAENSTTGNYQYAENVVASNCTICVDNPTPIWQFRAEQLYRDFDEQKIYLRNAYFDVFGITVGWIPYLRYPDVDAVRMDGFLSPEFISNNANLTGLKLPYYIPFSDYTDLTITPNINTSNLAILEGEFRHSARGVLYAADGVYLVNDPDEDRQNRYLLRNQFRFLLTDSIRGAAEYSIVSDYDFAGDYGYTRPSTDYVEFGSYQDNYGWNAEIIDYLPGSEAAVDREHPIVLPHLQGVYHYSSNSGLQLSADGDLIYMDHNISEDVFRIGADLQASYQNVLPLGLQYEAAIGTTAAFYQIENAQIEADNGQASLVSPYASLDLRYPLVKTGQNYQVTLTPRIYSVWRENNQDGVPIPNHDAQYAEVDTISLFAKDYFLGFDKNEEGLRTSIGLSSSVDYGLNHHFEAGLGRSFHSENDENSNPLTSPNFEEWVAYANYTYSDALEIYTRFAFNDEFDFTRNEIELDYNNDYFNANVNWVSLAAEPDLGFDDPRAQVSLDGDWQFAPNFKTDYNVRLDAFEFEPFDAGLGLTYGNECLEISSEVNWDFNQGNDLGTERSYSLSVRLPGITGDPTGKWAERTCRY